MVEWMGEKEADEESSREGTIYVARRLGKVRYTVYTSVWLRRRQEMRGSGGEPSMVCLDLYLGV